MNWFKELIVEKCSNAQMVFNIFRRSMISRAVLYFRLAILESFLSFQHYLQSTDFKGICLNIDRQTTYETKIPYKPERFAVLALCQSLSGRLIEPILPGIPGEKFYGSLVARQVFSLATMISPIIESLRRFSIGPDTNVKVKTSNLSILWVQFDIRRERVG
ncbi:hypothetical protein OCU04_003579 [Sclerotinia nivalis]|uniref:Uncharacterized protein n=1 Tax=Sclerotinia nivalis TaxID=352851 RepID=A0A9X0AS81_9HELO|nr:hypothetical protein OCU04_003579 [Sclerotinia nivalis]